APGCPVFPYTTLFRSTGFLAGFASIFGLVKLGFEMQKEDAYWTADHWARLGREGAMSGLMGMQAGLGGYATWMVITSQWTTAQRSEEHTSALQSRENL